MNRDRKQALNFAREGAPAGVRWFTYWRFT